MEHKNKMTSMEEYKVQKPSWEEDGQGEKLWENEDEKEVIASIMEELSEEEIPESLKPSNMQKKLWEAQARKKKMKRTRRWTAVLAATACMGILITAGFHMRDLGNGGDAIGAETAEEAEATENMEASKETEEDVHSKAVYDKIYDAMDKTWAECMPQDKENNIFHDIMKENATATDGTAEESAMTEPGESGSPLAGGGDMGAAQEAADSAYRGDYGETNVQVEFVDEGDIVKNDGRYLYQMVQDTKGSDRYKKLQIVDTKDGLKEISRIDGFSNISEFYIYEDTAVIIESLWADSGTEETRDHWMTEEPAAVEESGAAEKSVLEEDVEAAMEDVAICGTFYGNTAFSKIHMYDISNREKPKEIHTFTIKGSYKTSRISDGYFYFFTGYDTTRPKSRDDLEKYIPVIDGKMLSGSSLYLPENADATSYLVMVSVDMSNPTTFADEMAAVTWGNSYYVSGENIYVLDNQWADQKDYFADKGGEKEQGGGQDENVQCDKTRIMKFSYEKGQIEPVCEGTVDGTVLDQFAMDEYNGYFRLITTVNPYKLEKVVDDVTGEELGYYSYECMPESNSVYVLDEKLKVAGSIENLARDERVYSARFMGDTGYFVTFRQTDPLFSVDFSNPGKPKILGELKISGFSEYLHFYGEDMLLGIGYEADEDTGRTESIKLSIFDVSDPSNVKEIDKLVTEYEWSDALYNHHAVLVSVSKNLIGFMAEDYGNEIVREYTIYSYREEKGFKKKFTVDCSPTKENSYMFCEGRGTYIDETFYLLLQDGSVKAYDLDSGKMLEELKAGEKK